MVRINPEIQSRDNTTEPSELDSILARQRAAFNTNPNPNWASRKAKLETLRDLILGHEAEFVKAISDDFGHRAVEDTLISEFLVIQGGISHALKHTPKWMKTRKAPTAFSALTFDHLVFTGSTSVGRIVGEAAGKNLVPVTLELGGKSPVIIDESANMKLTVPRIANGKLLNAGQTCVAPDYVLMPKAKINAFSEAIINQAESFYPTVAGNPDYTTIIADSHYARLQDLLEDAENKGAKIRTAGDDDKQQLAKERRVPLTVVTDTTPDMRIMQEEIFGPLLPIVASETLDESLDTVQQGERPLALYWFGENKAKRDKVLRESISGGVSVNETAWHVVQEDIPFGGVGPSGMGAYHGEHGFKSFSHMKGVFIQSKLSQGKNLFPPYTDKSRKMIGMMKKILK